VEASRPVLIGYDGSPSSEHAISEAATLLGPRPALVVVVWKQGIGFEMLELPVASIGLPPAPIDIRTALEIDEAFQERAQRLAQQGAGLASKAGFDAEGLAVADDIDIAVAETLCRVAKERNAQAIVVGAHGHGRLDVILGTTTRDVIRQAPCPVVVVRKSDS
jgi:nucleotide-binding universal stress UspA family protein